jgi:hypothetical protein
LFKINNGELPITSPRWGGKYQGMLGISPKKIIEKKKKKQSKENKVKIQNKEK